MRFRRRAEGQKLDAESARNLRLAQPEELTLSRDAEQMRKVLATLGRIENGIPSYFKRSKCQARRRSAGEADSDARSES
jgi:hypothetical protein